MGVTVFVSSGDGGASPDGLTQVSSPANDPSVTAVGGTAIVLDANGAISKESVYNDIQFDYDSFDLGASGGGISTIFNRPAFQLGKGVPSGTFRLVPDVAAPGSALTGALVVLNGSDQQFGGTSWSSPTWAGICARINQSRAAARTFDRGIIGAKDLSVDRHGRIFKTSPTATTIFRDSTAPGRDTICARASARPTSAISLPHCRARIWRFRI